MVRLVFIDADGTLVGSSGTVLPAVWAAADRARSAGIRLALCTGRPGFGTARELADRLDVTGWHVFQNGASIQSHDQSRSTPVPSEIVARVIRRARAHGYVLELYGDRAYAVEVDSPAARAHADLLGIPFEPRPLESLASPIVRCQWLASAATAAEILMHPEAGLEELASSSPVMPETVFINMTARGVTKGAAIRTIASATGAPLAEIMFVGDGMNDLAGLQTVGFPVAMGNAEPAVRAAARTVVGHVDDGGLVEALELAIASRLGT
jgi:Cof subfamily protein (haloacid dehalogenase superfamily)